MINRIVETVKTLINTESNGNFSPKDFDLLLHNSVLEMFEEVLFEVNRLINRQNRGLVNGGLENVTDKLREKIQHYIEPEKQLTYNNPVFDLPADMRYFDAVFYNGERIELCVSNKDFNLISKLKHTEPSNDYPIGLKQGSTMKILPTTIVDNVTIAYLRSPVQAKWTYQVIGGVEVFNPSANDFKDVDIHPSQEDDLIIRVLKKFGVNLKEKDLQEISLKEEATEFNKKLTD